MTCTFSIIILHLDYLGKGGVDLRLREVGHCHIEEVVVDHRIMAETVRGKCESMNGVLPGLENVDLICLQNKLNLKK